MLHCTITVQLCRIAPWIKDLHSLLSPNFEVAQLSHRQLCATLSAASSKCEYDSPVLNVQREQYTPFRALANMVPEEGVPKYDFLRALIKGAVNGPATPPDSGVAWDFLRVPQRSSGRLSQKLLHSAVVADRFVPLALDWFIRAAQKLTMETIY